MSSDPDSAPINPLPAAVILLALPMVFVEIAFLAGQQGFVGGPAAVGWRLAAIERFGFFVPLLDYALESGRWDVAIVARLFTYPFVHWGFTHMLMVLVFLLALGKLVGDVFGSFAVLAIFFVSSILGALVFTVLTDAQQPLAGGYPGVYGLIGGYTFILWTHAKATGGPQHQAFALISVLLFIQLVFGVLFGGTLDWIAEIAGFCAGFLTSFVTSPGGWARVVARLRKR